MGTTKADQAAGPNDNLPPSRITLDCRTCGTATFCQKFRWTFAVLHRVDAAGAGRVRVVLEYAGLWPVGAPEPPMTE